MLATLILKGTCQCEGLEAHLPVEVGACVIDSV